MKAALGQEAVRGQVFVQLQGLLRPEAARTIEDLLVSVSKPAEGVMSTAIGVLLLLVGAVVAAMGKLWARVFAMIYKIMPRVSVKWRDVWLGAFVTSLLFTAERFLIEMYIGTSNLASGFGAAGSLIAVLVWVYYSAQIFLLSAEFTWIYAKTFGSMRDLQPQLLAKTGAAAPGFSTDRACSERP